MAREMRKPTPIDHRLLAVEYLFRAIANELGQNEAAQDALSDEFPVMLSAVLLLLATSYPCIDGADCEAFADGVPELAKETAMKVLAEVVAKHTTVPTQPLDLANLRAVDYENDRSLAGGFDPTTLI